MSSAPINLNLSKYAPPLTGDQVASVNRLSQLRFQTFNEADLREEFLVPLVGLLGYQRDSDYTVLREESFNLNPLCRLRIVELARLGNSFARKCAEQLGVAVEADYPDAAARLKALFTLGASGKSPPKTS